MLHVDSRNGQQGQYTSPPLPACGPVDQGIIKAFMYMPIVVYIEDMYLAWVCVCCVCVRHFSMPMLPILLVAGVNTCMPAHVARFGCRRGYMYICLPKLLIVALLPARIVSRHCEPELLDSATIC